MDALMHTPEEAKQVLNVSRSRVFELIASGELRSVKIGRSRRISTQALQEYVAGLDSQ